MPGLLFFEQALPAVEPEPAILLVRPVTFQSLLGKKRLNIVGESDPGVGGCQSYPADLGEEQEGESRQVVHIHASEARLIEYREVGGR